MKAKNILVACEESQAVTIELRNLGHNAFSCDILPCSGGHPEWHIKGDVLRYLKNGLIGDVWFQNGDRKFINFWDIVISFPPCTDLTVSGARWFEEKRNNGTQERSIRFFFDIWKYSNCTENPIGIMNGGDYIKRWFPDLHEEMRVHGFPFKPDQIIQPWQFGHGETKATCLWLKNIPPLLPTEIASGREQRIWKMTPGPERAKLRSKTFPGIAKAMAGQWGGKVR